MENSETSSLPRRSSEQIHVPLQFPARLLHPRNKGRKMVDGG